MRKLFLIAVMMMWAGQVEGATYYADPAGDNTDGSTWAKAKKKATDAATLITAAGDIVRVAGGTYTETTNIVKAVDGTSGAYIKIIGSSGAVPDGGADTGTLGRTIINSASLTDAATVRLRNNYWEIADIDFIGAAAAGKRTIDSYGTVGTKVHGCTFTNTANPFAMATSTGFLIYNNLIEGNYSTTSTDYSYVTSVGGGGSFYYNTIRPSATTLPRGILLNGTTAHFLYNNDISGTQGIAINYGAAAGTLTSANNIVTSAFSNGTPASSNTLTNGAWNSSNDMISPEGLASNLFVTITGGTLNITNPVYGYAKFTEPTRFGYFFYTMDDASSQATVTAAASTYFNPAGMYLSWAIPTSYIPTYDNTSTLDQATVQSFVNAGNDVVAHGFSHAALNSLNAISVTSTATAPTITVTATRTVTDPHTTWTGTVVLKENGSTVKTINLPADASTVGGVVTLIGSQANWAATVPSNMKSLARAVCLATVDNQAIGAGYTMLMNQAAFFKVEISEAKSLLEAYIQQGATGRAATYTIKHLALPSNAGSTEVQDSAATYGFRSVRGATEAHEEVIQRLDSFNPFTMPLSTINTTINMGTSGALYPSQKDLTDAANTYNWTASGSGTNEFYAVLAAGGGNPSLSLPSELINMATLSVYARGTKGSLAVGQWDYGDNDSLGYSTVYVRLSDGSDPDASAAKTVVTSDETNFKRNFAARLMKIEEAGLSNIVYGHASGATTNDTSLTVFKWMSEVLAQAKYANGKTKLNDFVDMVWDNTVAPDGNYWTVTAGSTGSPSNTLRFGHTWASKANFILLSSSPAINAGVDVGLTSDYRGMAVPQRGIPDIGAYEFGPGDSGYGGAYRGGMGIHWMW